ncbi:hypothetical protein BO94DRAFT_615992 [Aspergillus sclerotioniger CBS 115572]|uniref:Uncharacterized protein n=1 Tax=Aspergillus sclerotioniger CBS 115572 TaxID=1450535 RepID=A0A317X6E0_9EURO|nr:hypothetical protein BO94DRAFT_615992 [Aspergillus sclerotioniger CBS 115572]PWY93127.1 hypothetical protein BO94DRAFT_615992 [Aspergillus sclerotioniger CBS 115572]
MAQSSTHHQPQSAPVVTQAQQQHQPQPFPSARRPSRRNKQYPLGGYAPPDTSTALQPVRRGLSPLPSDEEEEVLDRGGRTRGKLASQPAAQDMDQMPEQEETGLKLKLELNLDVEVELKAKIHGDITLALL